MSTTTTADRFIRTEDFASRIDGLYLSDECWGVFAQLEQPASVEEIASRMEQPVDDVLASVNALLEHGLVRKRLRNWREFLAKKGDKPAASLTAPIAEAIAANRPGAALAGWPKPSAPHVPAAETSSAPAVTPEFTAGPLVPADADHADLTSDPVEAAHERSSSLALPTESAAPTEPTPRVSDFKPSRPAASGVGLVEAALKSIVSGIPARSTTATTRLAPTPACTAPRANPESVLPVSFSIVNEKARLERRASSAMAISFRVAGTKAPIAATTWKLSPLLKAIGQKAGGGLPGQLLVYRVFIHVPAEMMHAAGIQSLSLVDDSVVIRERAFYDALCQAAHAVAGIDLRAVAA